MHIYIHIIHDYCLFIYLPHAYVHIAITVGIRLLCFKMGTILQMARSFDKKQPAVWTWKNKKNGNAGSYQLKNEDSILAKPL